MGIHVNPRLLLAGLLCGMFFLSPAQARTWVPFKGQIDLEAAALDLRFGDQARSLRFDLRRVSQDNYRLKADLRHVTTPLWDVSGVVDGDIELAPAVGGARNIVGNISSRYVFVDYKPVSDLDLKFAVRERKLVLDYLWAGALSVRGELGLAGDRRTDIFCEVLSADLKDLVFFLERGADRALDVEGIVSGEVALNGPLRAPMVRGKLFSSNGTFNRLAYDTIALQFSGVYPRLVLADSMVAQTDGLSFKVSGPLDLSDRDSLLSQVRQLKKSPIITADRNKREWIFKRMSSGRDAVTEMKYFLNKDDRGDTRGVLGMEKRYDF
jgi:hypothetical protein